MRNSYFFNQIRTKRAITDGHVYQGGFAPEEDILKMDKPLIVVSLQKPYEELDDVQNDLGLLDRQGIQGFWSFGIYDWDDATLSDEILLAAVAAIEAVIKSGVNVFIHCAAGISRSSYLNVALHMRLLGLPFDEALDTIKQDHPWADPNAGFVAHLKRLEPRLING